MAKDKISLNQDPNQGKQYGPGAKQYSIRAMLEYLVALQSQLKSPNKQKWADNNQNKQQQSNLSIVNILKQSFENILNLLKKRSETEDKQNILIKKYTENVLKKLDTLNNTITNKQFTLERSNNSNNKLNEEIIANFLKNFDNNILTSIRDNLKIFNEKILSNLSNSSTSTSTPTTSNIVIDVSNLETILSDNNKSFKEILNDIQKQYTDIQNKLNSLNTKDTNNIGDDSAILANGLAAIYKYFDTNNDYLRQINGKIEDFDIINLNNTNNSNTNNSNIIIDDNSIKINIDDSELLKNIDNKLQQLVENKSTNNSGDNSITNTEISNITVQNEKPKVLADENYNIFFEKLNDYLKNTYESKINSITSTNSIIQRSLYKNGLQNYSKDTIYNEVSSIKTSINNFFKDYDISKLIQELKSNSEQQNKDKKISEENKQNISILTSEQPKQPEPSEIPKPTELPKGEPVSPSELEVTQETLTGEQPVMSVTTSLQNTLQGQVITLGSNLNTQNEVTSPESKEPIITINPQNVEQQKLSDSVNSASISVKPLPSMDNMQHFTEKVDNAIFKEQSKQITIASDIQQPISGLTINSMDKPKLESKELMALNLINEQIKQMLEILSGHFTFVQKQADEEKLYADSLGSDGQSLEEMLMGASKNGSKSIDSQSLANMLNSSDSKSLEKMLTTLASGDGEGGIDVGTLLAVTGGTEVGKSLLLNPGLWLGAGKVLLATAVAAGGLDLGYGLGTAIFDPGSVVKDKNDEDITFMDRMQVIGARMLHPFDDDAAFETYKSMRDYHKYKTADEEMEEQRQRMAEDNVRLREQFTEEQRKRRERTMAESGLSNNINDIVNKADENGVESLSEVEKMIYSKLNRDESGKLVTNERGEYSIDKSKNEELLSWINERAKSDKDVSLSDLSLMSKFNTVIGGDLTDSLDIGAAALTNGLTYTNESGETVTTKRC